MTSNASSQTPRWKWVAVGVLLLSGLSVPTGIVYLQHRLHAQPLDVARPWDDPKIAQKLATGRLAKAKAIRAEWRMWALRHKEMLKTMLASQGKDFSAVQAVYQLSPPLRMKDWKPDTTSGPVKFGWYSDPEKLIANGEKIQWFDATSKATFNAQKGSAETKLRREFGENSDFTVAESDNVGPTTTQLWASGRITEKTWVKNPNHSSGQPIAIQLPPKELVPPYEFLTVKE